MRQSIKEGEELLFVHKQRKHSIAVILATYNGEKYLDEQLLSILWQSYPVTKIIVRDDCSNDKTVEILKSYKRIHDAEIDIISDTVGRIGHAGGNFLKILQQTNLDQYDFVFFADQDDVWFPSKIERAVTSIYENSVDCYASNLLAYDAEKKRCWTISKDQTQTRLDYFFQGASAGCTYGLNKIAVQILKKHLVDKVDLTAVFSHDWLIYAVSRSYGCRWFIDSNSFIMYRQHSNNAYGDLGAFKNIFKKFQMVIGGWYKRQVLHNLQFLNPDDQDCRLVKEFILGSASSRIKMFSEFKRFRRKKVDSIFCVVYFMFN
jgi:rhamnosyltransferase